MELFDPAIINFFKGVIGLHDFCCFLHVTSYL